ITAERQIKAKMLQTEKMAALGQLVSGIAHELNNPLTAIMGYAQLLLGHGLADPQLSDVSKMYQEAERARRIVKNLLYFARENRPERTRVDLNEIVERTLALRSYELRVENIAVECNLAPDLPETMADPHQLQQVVLNLLVNAEQAVLEARGQGKIFIRTRKQSSDRVSVEISDDGPGVPREHASRIFDPFFTTKPPGVGTGLGLSIVYGIVKQHEGEVTFENVPGAGAKFTIELPVIAASFPARAGSASKSPGETGALRPGRILVVEDEPTVARLIVDVLGEEGHQVDAVLDSQEGLTLLSRASYDLVICDLRMPRLDGPAFYEALVRSGSPLRDHIVFITGDLLAARTRDFLEGHNFPYLAKPFLVEELKLAINRMLAQSFAENKTQRAAKAHSASTAGSGLGSRSRPK
ncbi:MAG: hybrid sensor histidine kinase/response regulator, partial [Candidatus Acidiferrales bacterium]